jgi:hypothetical protein
VLGELSQRALEQLAGEQGGQADPRDEDDNTRHGLRSTAINDRRRAGATDGGIADELCMSVAMVSRYLRFADKVESGRASRDRREQKQAEFANTAADLQIHRRQDAEK